jgi:hypothetical protein
MRLAAVCLAALLGAGLLGWSAWHRASRSRAMSTPSGKDADADELYKRVLTIKGANSPDAWTSTMVLAQGKWMSAKSLKTWA